MTTQVTCEEGRNSSSKGEMDNYQAITDTELVSRLNNRDGIQAEEKLWNQLGIRQ